MLHIVKVPLGCSAADIFFEKAMARGYNDVMLVTSSRALVQRARSRGVNAVNFDYLANAVLRQRGVDHVRKISRRTQELIVGKILDRLVQEGKLHYFAGLVSKKGFLRSMTALMDQIGRCGATPDEIATAFSHWEGRSESFCQKDWEVAEVYREYLAYLIRHDVFDVQGLYRMAVETVSALDGTTSSFSWKALYVMGFYQFDALQLEMIRQLSRFLDIWIALPYEAQRPELYGVTEFTYGSLMGYATTEQISFSPTRERKPALRHILQGLRNPAAKPVPVADGIEIWQTADKNEEIRTVLRDIKLQIRDRKVRPDEIAVVVRRMDEYSGIRAVCDEYGIPVQMTAGASLSANPLFNYMLAGLKLASLHGREKTDACIRFLSLPMQRFILGLPVEIVTEIAAQRYYTNCEAFMEQMFRCVENAALSSLWEQIKQIPAEAAPVDYCKLLENLLDSLSLFPKAGLLYRQGDLSLQEFKNIVCAEEAIRSILQKIPQDYHLGGLGDRNISCAVFADVLAEAAEEEMLSLRPENKEGILVLSAVNLEEISCRQVYVLGLQENQFPFLKKENWIYNDSERNELASLGINLPRSADGYQEDIHFFANVCVAAEERLVLAYSTEDDRNVSPYINEIRALFTNLEIQKKSWEETVENSLSRKEMETSLVRKGETGRLGRLVDPLLAEAGQSDAKRTGNEPKWNGMLEDEFLVQQVGKNIGNRFSASKLETFRQCPFKFLVMYGWQQQETEPAEEDIDPMQRGSLLHTVLERFVSRHLGEGLESSRTKELQDELDAFFEDVCREMGEDGRIFTGDLWNYDKEQLRVMLHRWLKQEISYSEAGNLRPVYTEKEFGRKDETEFSLDLENGERIFLNGKIDRIDRAENVYYITDYKSGDAPARKDFMDKDLQMPLYILAAETLFAKNENAAVIGGSYYTLKKGERKSDFCFSGRAAENVIIPWKSRPTKKDADGNRTGFADSAALCQALKEMVENMLQQMRNGRFSPTPTNGCEAYCPAARICRAAVLSPDSNEEESDG